MQGANQFTMLIDGGCPICRREVALLRRLDRGRGQLVTTDITADGFDAGEYGRPMDELMAEIHGVLPDGRVVTGMEVFRRAYASVGLGWLLSVTRWPILGRLADAAYACFARYRLTFFRRRQPCGTEVCQGTRQ